MSDNVLDVTLREVSIRFLTAIGCAFSLITLGLGFFAHWRNEGYT
jgi:hypothetical protein